MQKSDKEVTGRGAPKLPELDLSPPVCLDTWAITFVAGLVAATVVSAFVPALVISVGVICAGAGLWRSLVPHRWRVMTLISPLFLLAGVGRPRSTHRLQSPSKSLRRLRPASRGGGQDSSPPEPAGIGYGADLLADRLYYEESEIVTDGKLRVQSPDLRIGVGDEVRLWGEITSPEPSADFDYGRYLRTVSSPVKIGS